MKTENPTVKCPSCQGEFEVQELASIRERTVVYMELHHETPGPWEALLVSKQIIALTNLYRGVAKQLGADYLVYLHSFEMDDSRLKIGLRMVAKVKPTPAAHGADCRCANCGDIKVTTELNK